MTGPEVLIGLSDQPPLVLRLSSGATHFPAGFSVEKSQSDTVAGPA